MQIVEERLWKILKFQWSRSSRPCLKTRRYVNKTRCEARLLFCASQILFVIRDDCWDVTIRAPTNETRRLGISKLMSLLKHKCPSSRVSKTKLSYGFRASCKQYGNFLWLFSNS
jgi:hypothetical protein